MFNVVAGKTIETISNYAILNMRCNECNSVDFKTLFNVIFEYLQTVKCLGKDKNKDDIINGFSFMLCDQSNMNL